MGSDAASSAREEADHRLRALMAAAQDGDRVAYRELLRRCEPMIRRAARRAGLPPDLHDDAVQETLITLHNARQTYDPSRPFGAWLGTIAQRRAVDIMRRAGRNRRREVHAPAAYEGHVDPHADASGGWRESARAAELREAVAALTPGQREAVELIAVEGRSLAEASRASGRTTGALKVNFHRALAALRGRLERDGDPGVRDG